MQPPTFPDPQQPALEAQVLALQTAVTQLRAEHVRLNNHLNDLTVVNEQFQVSNEELQEVNTQLIAANQELDHTLDTVFHELRTPLARLGGLVDELKAQLATQPPQEEKIQLVLGTLDSSLKGFQATFDRLAAFGTKRQAVGGAWELINLATLIEAVQCELTPHMQAVEGRLLVDLAGQATVLFSPPHLRAIVYTLLSNAFHYHHPARQPVVHVRSRREPGRVVLSFQDNGLGLSEEQQEQLFTLFRRLHPHIEGTGVGLYLVKKILDNAGGAIRVESQLGRGSTFTVILPV